MASLHQTTLPPYVKMTGGKRGAPGPLIVTTSDEDSASDGETITLPSPRANITTKISPRHHEPLTSLKLDLSQPSQRFDRMDISREVRNRSPSPPNSSPTRQATEACEHDHDYENVASPSGSSTASGPVYVRPPGFQHHAQEIRRKKKKAGLLEFREGLKKRAPTPPKVRPRREPVPMRLRALPQSFWKQPNVPNQVSPGNMFSTLPPLSSKDSAEDITDIRPITPPDERERNKNKPRQPDRKLIVGDTDLSLKHLFSVVVDEKKVTPTQNFKRGRQRKFNIPKSNTKGLLLGDDPYLVDAAVTEKLFPQLSLEGTRPGHSGNSSLQLITLREGDKCVTLPSLSIEQNYSQMLSELAMNI